MEGSELRNFHIRQLLSSEVYCSVARILQNPVLHGVSSTMWWVLLLDLGLTHEVTLTRIYIILLLVVIAFDTYLGTHAPPAMTFLHLLHCQMPTHFLFIAFYGIRGKH